jgi:RNA polymerase sigma-70 factor, ECF subfamily
MIRTMDSTNAVSDLERSFLALHDREAGTILRYLRAAVGEAADPEDLAAETFARAWRSWSRFQDRDGESARNWLVKIARNLAVDSHRQRARRPQAMLSDSLESADPFGSSLDRIQLMRAIHGLALKDRNVVALRAAGLPFAAVGAVLGISEPAAKMAADDCSRDAPVVVPEAS